MATPADLLASFDEFAVFDLDRSQDEVDKAAVLPLHMPDRDAVAGDAALERMGEPAGPPEFRIAVVDVDHRSVRGRENWLLVTVVVLDARVRACRAVSERRLLHKVRRTQALV